MVTQEMVLIRMDEIDVYAEAATILRQVKGEIATGALGLEALRLSAVTVNAATAEALRAFDDREEVHRLRVASATLVELRDEAWRAFDDGALAEAAFDEIMSAATRCGREVDLLTATARARARRRIDCY